MFLQIRERVSIWIEIQMVVLPSLLVVLAYLLMSHLSMGYLLLTPSVLAEKNPLTVFILIWITLFPCSSLYGISNNYTHQKFSKWLHFFYGNEGFQGNGWMFQCSSTNNTPLRYFSMSILPIFGVGVQCPKGLVRRRIIGWFMRKRIETFSIKIYEREVEFLENYITVTPTLTFE